MVSDNIGSVLRSQEIESMQNFSWDFVIQELSVHAPNFLQLLHSIMSTKTDRDNQKAIIGHVCFNLVKVSFIQNESGPQDHIHYSVCWTYIKAGKHDCNIIDSRERDWKLNQTQSTSSNHACLGILTLKVLNRVKVKKKVRKKRNWKHEMVSTIHL